MTPIELLEIRIAKLSKREIPHVLKTEFYKQAAYSHKGKRTNGSFRNALKSSDEKFRD